MSDPGPSVEPLRVLHIGPTPFFSDRGCHLRIRGLVRALERQGVDSLLCTYHHGREVEGVRTRRIPRIPGYTQVSAGPSPFKYLADVLLFFTVCRAIISYRPHVIHGHLHEGALLGWKARTLLFWRRPPLVFDVQGSLTGELEQYRYFRALPPLAWLFAAVEWVIDRLPEALACSSAASLAIARDRFGVAPGRLHLVRDGADVTPPEAGRRELRRRLGLPEGTPVVVYAGSLLPVKGLDVLHETLRLAGARDLRAHFLVVGYPVESTERFVQERGLAERVTLAGRVPFERVGEYLAAADVAIEPKAAESGEASGKLLNYMAAGLPVVAFDTPNNREILAEAGCYALGDSAEALVEAVAELLRSPERRAALGRAAQARSRTTFSWDASAAKLLSIYRGLLGRDRPRDSSPA